MRKVYVYLIFFHHKTGFGSMTVNLNHKINSVETLSNIQNYIEKESKCQQVGIANYQLVCKEDVEEC